MNVRPLGIACPNGSRQCHVPRLTARDCRTAPADTKIFVSTASWKADAFRIERASPGHRHYFRAKMIGSTRQICPEKLFRFDGGHVSVRNVRWGCRVVDSFSTVVSNSSRKVRFENRERSFPDNAEKLRLQTIHNAVGARRASGKARSEKDIRKTSRIQTSSLSSAVGFPEVAIDELSQIAARLGNVGRAPEYYRCRRQLVQVAAETTGSRRVVNPSFLARVPRRESRRDERIRPSSKV